MSASTRTAAPRHSHVFLGEAHDRSERRTWAVIWLCSAMMLAEIAGGLLFGSIALVADGLHMSTHAGALLLAALAYTYARQHADDPRFSFGTGKLGDLAGFTSAIVLAMIAMLIGYEAVTRIFTPVPIDFAEAIPIACLGLVVNVASAWLLGAGDHHGHGHHGHHHGHGHQGHSGLGHDHSHAHMDADDHGHVHAHDHGEAHQIATGPGPLTLSIHEDGVPPRFRLSGDPAALPAADRAIIETVRPNGASQRFRMAERGTYLESVDEIPEPHAFTVIVGLSGETHTVQFEEHEHALAGAHQDNNMRAAMVHVVADAAVSVLVIVGLLLARAFGWLWMDPLAGIIGAVVIASWAYTLIRDTGAILLDMNPDRQMADNVRREIEGDGDELADLHIWRLGPGHFGAIVCVGTRAGRNAAYYRSKLARFRSLSHLTVEVHGV